MKLFQILQNKETNQTSNYELLQGDINFRWFSIYKTKLNRSLPCYQKKGHVTYQMHFTVFCVMHSFVCALVNIIQCAADYFNNVKCQYFLDKCNWTWRSHVNSCNSLPHSFGAHSLYVITNIIIPSGIQTWDLSICLYLNLKHGDLNQSATTAS